MDRKIKKENMSQQYERPPDKDELSSAASAGGPVPSDMEDSARLSPLGALAQSECDAELPAMLCWVGEKIGLE
ncbi:hypothetical protein PO909_008468 [Leuciscus waleckii]